MAVLLKCPTCEQKFRWEFAQESKWPKACPCCGADQGADDDDSVICMPSLRSARTKATDEVYRQAERGSEIRAQAAAEQLGVPVSEMSGLKITDMKTGVKPGETYAVDNTAANRANLSAGGSAPRFAGADGTGYSGQVQSGPLPNAGAKMRTALQQHHGQISRGSAVSDMPALETQQPGYRRRG